MSRVEVFRLRTPTDRHMRPTHTHATLCDETMSIAISRSVVVKDRVGARGWRGGGEDGQFEDGLAWELTLSRSPRVPIFLRR
jgi:hypothetical protein